MKSITVPISNCDLRANSKTISSKAVPVYENNEVTDKVKKDSAGRPLFRVSGVALWIDGEQLEGANIQLSNELNQSGGPEVGFKVSGELKVYPDSKFSVGATFIGAVVQDDSSTEQRKASSKGADN